MQIAKFALPAILAIGLFVVATTFLYHPSGDNNKYECRAQDATMALPDSVVDCEKLNQ